MEQSAQPEDDSVPNDYGGFNIDGILNLMEGDDDGNVDFGAIGMELATNLATVIDMNEVGTMATTLGLMLAGIGATNEIQWQNGMGAAGQQGQAANFMLNNGIAALVGQMLNNQQSELQTGAKSKTGDQNGLLGMSDMANLYGMLAEGLTGDASNPDISNIVGSILNNNAKSSADTSNKQRLAVQPGKSDTIADAIDSVVGSESARSITGAMADFVNGNDTADLTGIAQAIGIRNFFRTEEKKIPDGCPSCFNCMYPGSVCTHNATCNQFTGRCDCPSGWTGEDCLQPACLSPADEGKRPAAKNSHCHQDTECRPGWGGWNCNMCLNDSVCDALIPTGEGGRCYNGSELVTNVVGQCVVDNKGLSRYLPDGIVPKMTFGCNRDTDTCNAEFWVSGREAFYCNLNQCNVGTWGAKSTAFVDCQQMKCSCIPGRFLCGNYGLDISSVLNEVEGPMNIKCHDDGFSDCYIREFKVSKTLASIIGDDAINMECNVGQCLHYSQLPSYRKVSRETSKSNMLIGVATALLTVYFVLQVIKILVQNRNVSGSTLDTKLVPTTLLSTKEDNTDSDTGTGMGTEIDSMLKNTLRATVAFRDISYKIPIQGPDLVSLNVLGINSDSETTNSAPQSSSATDLTQNVEVLKGISGIVRPGEILAILGASGAGKSTLLDILSRREKCGKVAGKVLINNRDLINDVTPEEFHRMSGYVDQQDIHVATATVYESVMTSALLRLPRAMSIAAKKKRVCEVLVELGLWSVRDSKIGKSGARGISGGEMRRVSIACELVTSPSIIFLDEPTSGLDAYNAFVVMDTLSKLACRYGRTVICTIHQPRTDIFSMFNQLIVLAAGQMCYSGPADDMASYLASIGHPVPDGYNIADFSVDLVQQATVTSNGGQSQVLAETPKTQSDKITSNPEQSDGEWSPLLGSSEFLLAANTSNLSSADDKTKTAQQKPKTQHQFLIYNVDISLPQVLTSFTKSSQFRRICDELDDITGTDWSPTNFEMISSVGMTPRVRPVTPMQQVKVIFLNLYDLTRILYRHLSGKQVGTTFEDKLRPTAYEQFKVLSARIFRNLYRDPTLMLANYAVSLFIGLMCGVLFYQLDSSVQGMQNRLGLLIFILAFYGFGCTTSLLVFSEERLLYLRERANAYYSPLAYFMAKVTFDLIPLRVVPPLLLTLIAYPMIGLAATWTQFISFFSTLVLFNLTVASQMFFIGLLAEELVVSNFLASIMLLFSLLFGGLILNKESIPEIFLPFCRFSSFNLAYEALAINELRHAHIEEVRFGLEIQIPSASLISSFGFDLLAFWPDIAVLCLVLAGSLGLSLLWLTFVIKERR
ncbi:(ABC) transporter [Coemansia sp. RSA 1822]|nr:(ABC) transporter [Coemansia sp. RSA 638]KAJ2119175.1 (ABC) transporter [Coemansia sp. RSA 720]KAJ2542758.1 (ABC) transporter [Coemansia sp. RSA 1853]KAJ2563347.1 (ABC) transporter [Coemansia sp. RSA 1822]